MKVIATMPMTMAATRAVAASNVSCGVSICASATMPTV